MTIDAPQFIGLLQVQWTRFELALEIVSIRELGITPHHGHMIFGPMANQAKREICISLLKESKVTGASTAIEKIAKIGEIAQRNHLFHSIMKVSGDWKKASFIKRETKHGYIAKTREISSPDFKGRVLALGDLVLELLAAVGLSEADLMDYADLA